MLKNISPAHVVGWWVAAVIVLMPCSVVARVAITFSNAELRLVACVVPPAVMLPLWHGASPVTVAQLYSINAQSKEGRP